MSILIHTHTHTHTQGLPSWLRRQTLCLQYKKPSFDPWVRKILWSRKWQPGPVFLPGNFHGQKILVRDSPWSHKESDMIEQLSIYIYIYIYIYIHTHTHTHIYMGEGNGNPLQYSCLENLMDRGAWWAAVPRVTKSQTRLSDFTSLTLYFITGEGNGNPLQYSCLENPMDRGAWWVTVYGVTKSRSRLSD